MKALTIARRQAESEWIATAERAIDDGQDPRDWVFPLTARERLRLNPFVHEMLFWLTYLTGMRTRLRCPHCMAVGTFKMHGPFIAQLHGDRPARRWMCKWCGYYLGPEGRVQAFPSSKTGAWALPELGVEREPTPAEATRDRIGPVWPWWG